MFTTTIYYKVLQIVIFFVRRIFKSVCICMYNLYLLWILITCILVYTKRFVQTFRHSNEVYNKYLYWFYMYHYAINADGICSVYLFFRLEKYL